MTQLVLFILLMVCGVFFGRRAEKRHVKSIIARELETNSLPAVASRYPPKDKPYEQHLVSGGVVVASDYFKSFYAGLINIFGGSVTPFESLLDRGRREAILRMKAQAQSMNADFIFNVKLETSRIAIGRLGAIEVLAYGTALVSSETSSKPGNDASGQRVLNGSGLVMSPSAQMQQV